MTYPMPLDAVRVSDGRLARSIGADLHDITAFAMPVPAPTWIRSASPRVVDGALYAELVLDAPPPRAGRVLTFTTDWHEEHNRRPPLHEVARYRLTRAGDGWTLKPIPEEAP